MQLHMYIYSQSGRVAKGAYLQLRELQMVGYSMEMQLTLQPIASACIEITMVQHTLNNRAKPQHIEWSPRTLAQNFFFSEG